jgi:amino acid permease
MPPSLSRLAYVCEFFLVLLAITVVWDQVGGQGHLDLLPWYAKLILIVGFALVTVLGTAAAVSHERVWNGPAIAYLVLAILLLFAMGGVTYYYHLHEDDEDSDNNNGGVAYLMKEIPARWNS